jgi:maltooligosyltrehalose trehalohydrolase
MLAARLTDQFPIGAQVVPAGVNYRVWAPDARKAIVRVERSGSVKDIALNPDEDGYWAAADPAGAAGDLYSFILDDGSPLPDVASRFQPEGIDGKSECIDPEAYQWENSSWRRPGWNGQTTYEIHIGTLSDEGTFRSAIPKLGRIRELGVEAIEIMPVADFAGNRNWGYDGVCLFSPAKCYGRPDDLRALVDAAHGHGLAVILDVVYNHVGPQGGHFAAYCSDYFRNGTDTPWGRGFNLDGRRNSAVRDFLKANAAYWLDDFRIDGLRLDATHAIRDASPTHLIKEVAELAHARGAFAVAEDERNTTGILRTPNGEGLGVDAAWADDFHHQVRVALTGSQNSYFAGYTGKAGDIADTIENGWTYRGQEFHPWGGKPRGEPSRQLPTESFVYCIENHDQVGNRAFGERLEHLVDPAAFRAASMLLCLSPYPVLIFMGQDWAASAPFLFFSDHGGALGTNITKGRQSEFAHADFDARGEPPDPEDPKAFEKSKLSWDERTEGLHATTLRLYRACLRERSTLRNRGALSREWWTALSEGPLVAVHYRGPEADRLLLVNLRERSLFPESLPESLKPGPGRSWHVILNTEAREFGGLCASNTEGWTLHGPGALWLEARGKDDDATH